MTTAPPVGLLLNRYGVEFEPVRGKHRRATRITGIFRDIGVRTAPQDAPSFSVHHRKELTQGMNTFSMVAGFLNGAEAPASKSVRRGQPPLGRPSEGILCLSQPFRHPSRGGHRGGNHVAGIAVPQLMLGKFVTVTVSTQDRAPIRTVRAIRPLESLKLHGPPAPAST